MADVATTEILEVLKEIRELLRPVADAHVDAYHHREAEREAARIDAIRGQLSSDKRRQAWTLADGTRTQREIARAVSMDEGAASRFFKLNRTRPTILHLAGHGGVTGIALEDDRGMATDVSTDQLTRLIGTAEDSLRLVVMNTCESAHQAQPMTATVDAAIGMTRSIGDDAARTFAAQLYASLGEGVSLDRAFEQARLQISLAGLPEDTTPALFLRSGVDVRNLVFIA